MKQNILEQFIKDQGWSMFGIVDFAEISKNLKKHEQVFEKWIKK